MRLQARLERRPHSSRHFTVILSDPFEDLVEKAQQRDVLFEEQVSWFRSRTEVRSDCHVEASCKSRSALARGRPWMACQLLRNQTMAKENAAVAMYASHETAEAAVKELQRSGFDMHKLSILGKDYHLEESPIGFYNTGNRMAFWGKTGAFWGSLWGIMFGSALFVIPVVGHLIVLGPLVSTLVGALEGAAVGGSAGVLGGALASVGIPKNSVVKYERQIAAGEFLVLAHGNADEIERAKAILQRAGASSVEAHAR